MSTSPRFTVVMACHQTASYLSKSLDSVSRQTFADFDAICYVEESTDGSLEICRDHAAKDLRFKVVSAPKSGAVATTRNYGIDHADGEYIVVLDGDDWLELDALAKIDAKLRAVGNVDVLSFAASATESEDTRNAQRISNFTSSDESGAFSGAEAIRRAGRNGGRMGNYTWLSAYRTAFLRASGVRQSDGVLMEDFESTPRIWFAAKKFAYLDDALYVYRRRPGSLTTEASPRIAIDIARQFRSLADFAANSSAPDDILKIWGNQWISTLYWFLFHPVTSKKVSNADRRRALDILTAGNGIQLFKKTASRASLPKRVAIPLVLLAAKGWQFPAKLYFRKLYYPLVERRSKG